MNDHELDVALGAIGANRTRVAASPALRNRVRAVPLQAPQQRSWLPQFATWSFGSLFSATKFVVAGAIVALAGGLLLVAQPFDRVTVPGAESEGLPPLTGPAGNGLIAFLSRDGDIYVGDPVTGESEMIVQFEGTRGDHAGQLMWPLFSPDGTRLALLRIIEWVESGCDVLVAAADGSDVRRISTEGIYVSCYGPVGWTPDSRGVVTGSFFLDASGLADPVHLPDGTNGRLSSSWDLSNLRPPDGDRVLVRDTDILALINLDGSDYVELHESSGLAAMDYDTFADAGWSPDGSRIAVVAEAGGQRHLYVMDADGSDLRRLGTTALPDDWDTSWEWSPDGSMIALQDAALVERSLDTCPGETEPICAETTWITLIDVESGEERVLDATRSPYEGDGALGDWAWSPDGEAILVQRGYGSPLGVVDIETDTVTELPWEIEPPFLSWQRVAAD